MGKNEKNNFGYLGVDYQYNLINQIIVDAKFGESVIDAIDHNYFETVDLKTIVVEIKNIKDNYGSIPDFPTLEIKLKQIEGSIVRDFTLEHLNTIRGLTVKTPKLIQEEAVKFCKQQELSKAVKKIQKLIDTGKAENFDSASEFIKTALDVGYAKEDDTTLFEGINEVLADDYRNPILTGIAKLDEVMNGGLSKTELGVVVAPFGVGKTTLATKMANSAFNHGYNVLQVFFEDQPKVIKRKHYACWTNIELNNLGAYKDEVIEKVKQMEENAKGGLKLKRFPSDGTTMKTIRKYIEKKISEGFRPDIILLDYIDCVQPSKKFDDVYAGEGNVMREFETMLSDFNIAGWTFVQGNRSSIKAEVVEADQIGGSIKKGQIGHFIMSIAKSLPQKDSGHANIAILKSRFGRDGLVFQDCVFDNARIQIDIGGEQAGITDFQAKTGINGSNQQMINSVLNRVKASNTKTEPTVII
tara:strand:- start:1590 stop:2999 length:1410 start_codon:yes stop_codon:yes gene_type:complete